MSDNFDQTIRINSTTGNNSQGNPADDLDRTIVANRDMPSYDAGPMNDGMGGFGQTLRTAPRPTQNISQEQINTDATCFILKGEPYYLVRSLSENSGEAQVFLVTHNGQEMVLKIYYPNYDVNKNLMQVIHGFNFEMIVRLYDFGKTYVDGKHRFYELMEYLKGGTLQDYNLNGDLNKFRRIVLQAAGALAYCHQNNILHKDIKPANFFFRDEAQTEVVLGDFGISSMLESDGKTYRTTQARTPIFAAPEMYADVIDGEVEVTPAADYYSLGITLFALWLGENPMSSNERVMMRQKNEGRLPRLEELPPRVKLLIQGLTAVNPQSRWKYDEVERWFLGEDVPIDQSSPFLRYKTFIVDPDRNLVADNIHELVPLLLANEQLAINYLYNGRITTWLETCGNTKLSALVKDIIVNRYPVDQYAGLMAAVYVMEPTYPYHDVQDEICDDIHSIALSLISYKERYALELQNPNNRLFLWLESHTKLNVNQLRSYFTTGAQAHVAIMRLIYEIDPDIPFLSRQASSTKEEIVRSFGTDGMTEDDWTSLVDGRLLSWMHSHEDVIACEALRIMTEGQPFSMTLAYKVLYNLDREAAYDLRDATTPQQVGQLLARSLQLHQHTPNNELETLMQDFIDPEGRFFYYAQLHGWYELMAEAKRCFDLQSEENRERLSAYDMHTALYRFCRILGFIPPYKMPDGTMLTDIKALGNERLRNSLRNEIRTGSLMQWTSIFFHEDPSRDFAEEYSYENEMVNWLKTIGTIDPQQLYYKRFMKAQEDTTERIATVRRDWNMARLREITWRYLFYGLSAVWIALLLIYGIDNREYLFVHPFMSIMLPLGFFTCVIVSTKMFFNGLGPFISFIIGLASSVTAYGPYWLMKYVNNNYPSFFIATMILLTLVYIAISHFTDYRHNDSTNAKAIKEMLAATDINTSLMEPLYYTFKTKSYRYKSSKFGLLDDISNQVGSISGETVIHYIQWGLLMLALIAEFCVFSPKLMNVENPQFGQEDVNNVIENVQKKVVQ